VQRMCGRVGIIKEGKIIEIADMRTLQQTAYKKVRVVADGVDAAYFNIPGVTNLEYNTGVASFFYKGDINAVMRKISGKTVSDVSIEEPTLEEIFMHYYE
jgi:beta-exotoxin I transport system ATP-binding protein